MSEERKINGVLPEIVPGVRDYDYEVVCGSVGAVDYPAEYEIPRANTGTLKDQGTVGACVAETCTQIAEEWCRRALGVQEEHSEGFFYGANRNDNSTGEGMTVSTALDYWVSKGSVPKKFFDILVEMPDMKKLIRKYPELLEEAKKYRLKGWVRLRGTANSPLDLQIKEALTKYQYGLVAVSEEGFQGGAHCIQLTGWNDTKDRYKFKNSWGATYGDNGFSEINKKQIDGVYLPMFEDIELPFKDVQEDDWFYNDLKNVYFAGIIKGLSEDMFGPNEYMTRAQVVAIINRIMKEMDKGFKLLSKVITEKMELKH